MQNYESFKDDLREGSSTSKLHIDTFISSPQSIPSPRKNSSKSPKVHSPVSTIESNALSSVSRNASTQNLAKQLSTRLYSEQLLRYQSESIINSQKDSLTELKELTRNEINKLQTFLDKSHEREISLIEEREKYKARLLSIWVERRDLKIMGRCFSAWRENIHERREQKLQEKMAQSKAFWIWRGISSREKTVNEFHIQAIRNYVNLTSQERLLRWVFHAWRNVVSQSKNSKLQFITSPDSNYNRNKNNNSQHNYIPISKKTKETTENNVQTISVELMEEEPGLKYSQSYGIQRLDYISPKRSTIQEFNLHSFNPESKNSLKALQNSLSDRLSKPRIQNEKFHSVERKWNDDSRPTTPLSSRSSSKKKQRSSSAKKVRSSTNKANNISSKSSPDSSKKEFKSPSSTPKTSRELFTSEESRAPRLTEEDKRRIKEILENEMKRT